MNVPPFFAADEACVAVGAGAGVATGAAAGLVGSATALGASVGFGASVGLGADVGCGALVGAGALVGCGVTTAEGVGPHAARAEAASAAIGVAPIILMAERRFIDQSSVLVQTVGCIAHRPLGRRGRRRHDAALLPAS